MKTKFTSNCKFSGNSLGHLYHAHYIIIFLDAETDRLSSASYSPSSSSDYLNVSDTNAPKGNESEATGDSPVADSTTTKNSSPEESVELSCPSPETLQAALDELFSEVSQLSCCATDSKETVPIIKENEECKPSTVIPQYYSYHAAEEVSYQYYGIV